MNAIIDNVSPLPSVLLRRLPTQHPGRRHHIGGFSLDESRLDRFNELLARLDANREALESDQLACAARTLVTHTGNPADAGSAPACIREQMRRAAAIELMSADPAWVAANDAVGPAQLVVDYVRSGNDLIPDAMPRIGRLDDAIVIDAAWPLVSAEVISYLDYCRLRRIEAELRGSARGEFAFTRADWEQARRAETAWIGHCREVGTRSYVSTGYVPTFRVC